MIDDNEWKLHRYMEIYLWLKLYGCFCRKIILEVGESLFFMKFVMWHLKLSFTHKCLHNIFNLYIVTFIILQYTTLTLLYLTQKWVVWFEIEQTCELSLVLSFESSFLIEIWYGKLVGHFLKIVLWHSVSSVLQVVFGIWSLLAQK